MRIRSWYKKKLGWVPRPVRQVIVLVIGGTLLVLALVGMILPIMPGVIFIPFALAIIALEFTWAGLWLRKVRAGAKNVHQRVKKGLGMKSAAPAVKKSA